MNGLPIRAFLEVEIPRRCIHVDDEITRSRQRRRRNQQGGIAFRSSPIGDCPASFQIIWLVASQGSQIHSQCRANVVIEKVEYRPDAIHSYRYEVARDDPRGNACPRQGLAVLGESALVGQRGVEASVAPLPVPAPRGAQDPTQV